MYAFSLIPIFILLFYVAIIVFVVWYAFKFLAVQTERNEILRDISNKLDNKDE